MRIHTYLCKVEYRYRYCSGQHFFHLRCINVLDNPMCSYSSTVTKIPAGMLRSTGTLTFFCFYFSVNPASSRRPLEIPLVAASCSRWREGRPTIRCFLHLGCQWVVLPTRWRFLEPLTVTCRLFSRATDGRVGHISSWWVGDRPNLVPRRGAAS